MKNINEKRIIEALLLELQVLKERIEDECINHSLPNGAVLSDLEIYTEVLVKLGYKSYPDWKFQTDMDKAEIRELIKYVRTLSDGKTRN